MKNTIKVATLLSLSAATLLASGYRIPEQSLNSTALSAAYVASANGADASYMNVGKDKVDMAGKNSRANAFSVRCVKVD